MIVPFAWSDYRARLPALTKPEDPHVSCNFSAYSIAPNSTGLDADQDDAMELTILVNAIAHEC
ncbi:predicted protein [Plenodomus lingam JN3]|uniref:Predicted protein n=1 Tax=Leptosphaeria maculans (strain JN3 / isolate v23.1.3 / race Av1-4-5-6-7-8) TaxID=985895 RepID=E4ZIP9_LEPMJ|nr:predicted protein [Plenodomus lingam JN3]CBX91070.1 predicted protein [Plenodomus lingam JN3]